MLTRTWLLSDISRAINSWSHISIILLSPYDLLIFVDFYTMSTIVCRIAFAIQRRVLLHYTVFKVLFFCVGCFLSSNSLAIASALDRFYNSLGIIKLVEIMRIELMTPCLQGRCSPSWAIPPRRKHCYLSLQKIASWMSHGHSKLNSVWRSFRLLSGTSQ